jgi:hypothetical protein
VKPFAARLRRVGQYFIFWCPVPVQVRTDTQTIVKLPVSVAGFGALCPSKSGLSDTKLRTQTYRFGSGVHFGALCVQSHKHVVKRTSVPVPSPDRHRNCRNRRVHGRRGCRSPQPRAPVPSIRDDIHPDILADVVQTPKRTNHGALVSMTKESRVTGTRL